MWDWKLGNQASTAALRAEIPWRDVASVVLPSEDEVEEFIASVEKTLCLCLRPSERLRVKEDLLKTLNHRVEQYSSIVHLLDREKALVPDFPLFLPGALDSYPYDGSSYSSIRFLEETPSRAARMLTYKPEAYRSLDLEPISDKDETEEEPLNVQVKVPERYRFQTSRL